MAGVDWQEWHQGYADPTSSLSARLAVVRQRIGEALDALGPRCTRILSLCAGDGRDLLPELAARPEVDADVLLVELDPSLADRGGQRAADLGLRRVRVEVADAGARPSFADVLPVDLLLLCGIFGNVADEDIRATLDSARSMVAPGGFLVWTRGRFTDVDLRPAVRRWTVEAGFTEVAYDGDPAPYGVGLYRAPSDLAPAPDLPERLFTFIR